MTSRRKRELTIAILEYLATHMEEVLRVEGPHELANDDEEDGFLIEMFHREADKIRSRARKVRR